MKEIKLSKAKIALIDDDDFERVTQYKWFALESAKGYFYAARNRSFTLHKFLMNPPKGMEVDHINGNTLDNRRNNLRICTHAENQKNKKSYKNNTSGYRGVSRTKKYGRWYVYIRFNNKKYHLGYFDTPEDASKAYLTAKGQFFKDFGIQQRNFI